MIHLGIVGTEFFQNFNTYFYTIVVMVVKKLVDIECKAGRDKCNLKVVN